MTKNTTFGSSTACNCVSHARVEYLFILQRNAISKHDKCHPTKVRFVFRCTILLQIGLSNFPFWESGLITLVFKRLHCEAIMCDGFNGPLKLFFNIWKTVICVNKYTASLNSFKKCLSWQPQKCWTCLSLRHSNSASTYSPVSFGQDWHTWDRH